MVRTLASTIALAMLVVVPGVIAGCGQSGTGGTVESIVTAELGEYYIKLDKTTVPAGKVTFAVTNVGKMDHELIIFKTDLAADKLPTEKDDPTRVDEEKIGAIGEVEDIGPNKTKSGTFDLTAGKYVLICNKPGHYVAGQRIAFEVT
jgi:uncharacterized cupredoxin-like copper-binding protein